MLNYPGILNFQKILKMMKCLIFRYKIQNQPGNRAGFVIISYILCLYQHPQRFFQQAFKRLQEGGSLSAIHYAMVAT